MRNRLILTNNNSGIERLLEGPFRQFESYALTKIKSLLTVHALMVFNFLNRRMIHSHMRISIPASLSVLLVSDLIVCRKSLPMCTRHRRLSETISMITSGFRTSNYLKAWTSFLKRISEKILTISVFIEESRNFLLNFSASTAKIVKISTAQTKENYLIFKSFISCHNSF